MCLITEKMKFKAEEDIRTWKAVLISDDSSVWRGILVKNDKTFPFNEVLTNRERKGVVTSRWCTQVGKGFFHSSKDKNVPHMLKSDLKKLYGRMGAESKIPEGFRMEIVECVIPKGTECYMDYNGNYASRKIKVIL